MNYSDFSNPKSLFQNSDNATKYNPKTKNSYTDNPNPPKKEAEFTYLSPIYDGVGDYHVNHFIAYFEPQKEKFTPNHSITFFYQKFCEIFSLNNIAKASMSDKMYKGNPTVKFTIGGDIKKELENFYEARHKIIGIVHDDWVQMQYADDSKSFYGTTLKRNWDEKLDDFLKSDDLSDINKKHFLAGRRSWTIGFDESLNLYFVETAALERSSDQIYDMIEKTGKLREDIIALWTNLLENYALFSSVIYCDLSLPKYWSLLPNRGKLGEKTIKYNTKKNVAYAMASFKSFSSVFESEWFPEVLKRHPGLVKDL